MKNTATSKINLLGIIILAAGASRRMGTPKQLLKIGHQTLIERAISIAQALDNQQTVVVLGANAEKISPYIPPQEKVNVIINENWQQGMGTTLKAGMEFFLKQSENFTAVIVMVCDQPYLTTKKLQQLIIKYQETKAAIIATKYNRIKGVPALFDKRIFPKLIALNKDEGARKIIKNYDGVVATVDFPKGIIDLDTPTAYQAFLEKHNDI
ncbi:MAG: NTP transferase domain-containing protein [Saprospiraceae bacterium]